MLPDATLLIAGEGPEREALQTLARIRNVSHRVQFVGSLPQKKLRDYYEAADCLVLASSREGWPNVLLESMACGTPVIATQVGGTPEVVTAPEAGILVQDRTPEAIAAAVGSLRACHPGREATRCYAEKFSWDETTRGQIEVFRRVKERSQ
jgi:glycosyltransferase involved in cell wall biosynthesis